MITKKRILSDIHELMDKAYKDGAVFSIKDEPFEVVEPLCKEFIEVMEESYYNSTILKKIDEYSEVMDLV